MRPAFWLTAARSVTADDELFVKKRDEKYTFSAVLLEMGPWNQGSRASRAACVLADSGSASAAGEEADADDDDAADDVTGVAVNGSVGDKRNFTWRIISLHLCSPAPP